MLSMIPCCGATAQLAKEGQDTIWPAYCDELNLRITSCGELVLQGEGLLFLTWNNLSRI